MLAKKSRRFCSTNEATRVELVDMEANTFVEQLLDRLHRAGGYLGKQMRTRRLQVFISYERSDENAAKRLYETLPKDQFETWLDTSFLQGGEDWNSELEEKIRSSARGYSESQKIQRN